MGNDQLTGAADRRWTRVGALAAVACALGYLETFLPIPIPGVKLGLANIAVLVALAEGDAAGAAWVALVKVITSGLLFGSPVTLAYSQAGTLLSLAVMVPLSRLRTMRLWMTSVVGALAHEAGQLLVAQAMLGTPLVWWSAPLLAVAGCLTGLLCGLVAERTVHLLAHDDAPDQGDGLAEPLPGRMHETEGRALVDGRWALALLLAFWIAVLNTRSLAMVGVGAAVSALICTAIHVRPRAVLRALGPTVPLCAVTFAAQCLSLPSYGEAAVSAATSSLRLVAIVLSSLAFTHTQTTSSLLGLARQVASSLKVVGIPLAGPSRAFGVTVRLLPLLSTIVAEETDSLGSAPSVKGMVEALPHAIVRTIRAAEALA